MMSTKNVKDVYKSIEDYNPGKESVLIVFNDLISDEKLHSH